MSSYCRVYDAYSFMDKITESFCRADVLYGLRPALEKFGFSKKEDVFVAFQYQDKEYKSGAIPPLTEGRMTTLNTRDLKAALLDWLNKTELQEEFSEAVANELDLPKEGDFPMTVKFMSDSFDVSLRGRRCCPCSPTYPPCCYK